MPTGCRGYVRLLKNGYRRLQKRRMPMDNQRSAIAITLVVFVHHRFNREQKMQAAKSSNSIHIKKERMLCMEILGGNLATDKAYEAPGLDIYIHSEPYRSSKVGGGDVYYLTSCASGRISRLLLADISGHGESAAELANAFKSLLQKNVNRISQSGFVQQMNEQFLKVSPGDQFATAVVATYFEPQKRLALGMAGHPNPLVFRSAEKRWFKVDEHLGDVEPRFKDMPFRNMPLGTVDDSAYPTRNFNVDSGDMFLLYSDAVVESYSGDSHILGVDGVLELLNGMDFVGPHMVIPELLERVRSLSPNNLKDDDLTLILGSFTKTKASLKATLASPFRLLGKVTDRTKHDGQCTSCK